MKYRLYLIFYFLILCSEQCLATEDLVVDNLSKSCQLDVGWTAWKPYQYLSDDNTAMGIQIDLLNNIASKANCQLDFIQQSFIQNVSDIENGKIDMMADVTVTNERQNFALFSDPYRHEISLLYVKADAVEQCKDKPLEQLLLAKFRLGLTKGYIYGDKMKVIQKNDKFSNDIVYFEENNDSISALLNGSIDGFFEDPLVLAYELKKKELFGLVKSCRVEIYAGDISLMFSKLTVDMPIVTRFNKALALIKRSAEYKENWDW